MLDQHPLIERAMALYYKKAALDAKSGRYWPQVARDSWEFQYAGDEEFIVAFGGWGAHTSDEIAKWRVVGDRLIRVRLH